MFCIGDLIRVPSQVGLYKMKKGSMIDFYTRTSEPKMGIFMNYQGTYECVVNVDGQDWLVGVEDIRMMETEDGKTYTN
jgi:hypothetical protein